jgi:hypothetical protein
MRLVTRSASGLWTPRAVMQWCVALTRTPTPRGFSTCSMTLAICAVSRLDLQAPCINLNHSRELADADHTAIGNVGHPCAADNGRQVVLATALEADTAQHDHLIVAFDLIEGFAQHRRRILTIADESLFQRASDARGSFNQSVAFRIVAAPADDGAHGGLDLGAVRLADAVQASCQFQSVYVRAHAINLLGRAWDRRHGGCDDC